jgi:predicted ester cyclase
MCQREETMMSTRDLAEAFIKAFEAGDFDTVASYLSDDFAFSGPTPQPVGKDEWIWMSKVLKAGFPDLRYNIRVIGVEGNVVRTVLQLTGTHTADLDLSFMGMGIIPATGGRVSNPEEKGETTVEGDKIVAMHVHSTPETGLAGMLAQLGVQLPQM